METKQKEQERLLAESQQAQAYTDVARAERRKFRPIKDGEILWTWPRLKGKFREGQLLATYVEVRHLGGRARWVLSDRAPAWQVKLATEGDGRLPIRARPIGTAGVGFTICEFVARSEAEARLEAAEHLAQLAKQQAVASAAFFQERMRAEAREDQWISSTGQRMMAWSAGWSGRPYLLEDGTFVKVPGTWDRHDDQGREVLSSEVPASQWGFIQPRRADVPSELIGLCLRLDKEAEEAFLLAAEQAKLDAVRAAELAAAVQAQKDAAKAAKIAAQEARLAANVKDPWAALAALKK